LTLPFAVASPWVKPRSDKYLFIRGLHLPWWCVLTPRVRAEKEHPNVHVHRTRTLIISAILVAATFLTSVATALAEGTVPPVPR